MQFQADFPTALDAAYLAFLGPLLGSLIRPVGGMLADTFGGARVTFCTFLSMAVGATVVFVASQRQSLPLYVIGFTLRFLLSGLGNGSTYKMIPAIFRAKSARRIVAGAEASVCDREARRLSGALIGIAGAVGAFGGVLVNVAFRQFLQTTGSADAAYLAFLAYYGVCVVLTWAVYLRPSAGRLAGV